MLNPMSPLNRKLTISLILVASLLATNLTPLRQALFENSLITRADRAAETIIDEAFGRALATFALARATNAVISVIQETEIEVSPAGVGVSLALGQALDPVNDLVERFSWVMLVALTSLGLQKFLIEVAPWLSVQLLATLALTFWLAGMWLSPYLRLDLIPLARRLLFLSLLVRFAVPMTAGLNQLAYDNFLADRYTSAAASVASNNEQLQVIDPSREINPEMQDLGWWQRLKQSLSPDERTPDFPRLLAWAKEQGSHLIDNFLALTVVFVLNTVLLPLAFLWGVFRLFRALTASPLAEKIETRVSAAVLDPPARDAGKRPPPESE